MFTMVEINEDSSSKLKSTTETKEVPRDTVPRKGTKIAGTYTKIRNILVGTYCYLTKLGKNLPVPPEFFFNHHKTPQNLKEQRRGTATYWCIRFYLCRGCPRSLACICAVVTRPIDGVDAVTIGTDAGVPRTILRRGTRQGAVVADGPVQPHRHGAVAVGAHHVVVCPSSVPPEHREHVPGFGDAEYVVLVHVGMAVERDDAVTS